MVDNTLIKNASGGTENIADDDISGGVADGAKVQRVKVGHGPDGSYVDADQDYPLPTVLPSKVVTGSAQYANDPDTGDVGYPIPQTDVLGYGRVSIQAALGGLWLGGALAFEMSNDANDWFPLVLTCTRGGTYIRASQDDVYFGSVNARYVRVRVDNDMNSPVTCTMVAASSAPPDMLAQQMVDGSPLPVSLPTDNPVAIRYAAGATSAVELDATTPGFISPLTAYGEAGWQLVVSGTWVGSLAFVAGDADTDPKLAIYSYTTGTWVTTITTNGRYAVATGGATVGLVAPTLVSGVASVMATPYWQPPVNQLVSPVANGAAVATGNPLPVTVTGTATVGGAVSVSNLPAAQPVTDNGGSLTVDGSVSVSNFPGTQPVSIAAALPITDNNGSLTVDGSVSVSNFPAAQPITDNGGSLTVDGSVSVSNFPATQPVSIAAALPVTDNNGSLTVDGSVSITGTPSVSISGTPTVNTNTHAVTASGAFPVTDNAGSLTVDDGGGSLTVDGSVSITGTSPVTLPTAGTGTLSNVAGAAASTQLLASNANRKGVVIWNESTALLYVAYAAAASATAYTYQIVAGGYLEMAPPFIYTGIITGIWAAANGNARVTELS